ncbi:MAG: RluA family pseudouridine synthase [Planctomycetota bacterium]|nr:RluA family pseudouridine synthase [Planctomycetota bacterium]
MSDESLEFALDAAHAGKRLDAALALMVKSHSRSFLTKLLKDGAILVDGRSPKASYKVRGGEKIEIEFPEPEVIEARPENIPLEILFEDADIIVVNKPPGMPAHPSSGHGCGTLVNALLGHCKDLSGINGSLRPGIVHRLDMDTSGAIVAAKNDAAHQALQDQFMARTVAKRYLALCHGSPLKDTFFADGRIGRHPVRRTEMAVLRGPDEGREAYTDFEVLQRLRPGKQPLFLVLARPKTGRTHQIRVHLAKAGYPILADEMYGKEPAWPDLGLARQALHAWKLEIAHPRTAERMCFEAPLADDIHGALLKLGGRWPA